MKKYLKIYFWLIVCLFGIGMKKLKNLYIIVILYYLYRIYEKNEIVLNCYFVSNKIFFVYISISYD